MGVAAGISKRRIRGGDNLILRSGWDFVFDHQRERERELWLIRATLFHFVAEMENRFVVFFTLERDSSFFVYVVLSMLAGWEDKILISFDYRERKPYKDRSKASRNLVLEMEKLIFIFVHEDYGESFPRVLNSSLIERFDISLNIWLFRFDCFVHEIERGSQESSNRMISLHCNDNNQKALKALKEYINESKEASRLIRRKDISAWSFFLLVFNEF